MSLPGSIHARIQAKLDQLVPVHLDVINESHQHNVPPGAESHFKVVLVSKQFVGQKLLARHRRINQILADELACIHALALHPMTPDEWFEKGGNSNPSPPCLGAKPKQG